MKTEHVRLAAACVLYLGLLVGSAGISNSQTTATVVNPSYGQSSGRPAPSMGSRFPASGPPQPFMRSTPSMGGNGSGYYSRGQNSSLPTYQQTPMYSYGHTFAQPEQSRPSQSTGNSTGPVNCWPGYFNGEQTYSNTIQVGPTLLGGYYFSDYSDDYCGASTLPSVYSLYPGFPGYVYYNNDGYITVQPYPGFSYSGGYIPFDGTNEQSPQVNNQYNNYTTNNYYAMAAPADTGSPQPGNGQAAAAAGSSEESEAAAYVDAFLDIQSAWQSGTTALLQKHLRTGEVQVAVSVNGAYVYSMASDQFAKTTQDAFDKLQTTSFKFTTLRKETNGDITGFATHVFSAAGSDGSQRTMYLSFTLSKRAGQWIVVAINSSAKPIAPDSTPGASLATQSN